MKNRKNILTAALENAQTKLAAKKVVRDQAKAESVKDNSRKNRKALRKAQADVNRAVGHVAHLTGELAVADAPKTYDFPKKAATVAEKPVKEKTRREKRHPAMAKPVEGERVGNPDWAAEKAAKAEQRKAKPVFVSTPKPNHSMVDATEQELIATCWAEYEAGNENALEVLRDLLPAETVTPADVDVDAFVKERKLITSINKSLAELPYKWERIQSRKARAEEKLAKAEKLAFTARMTAAKARKAYGAASDEEKATKYERLMELKRHAIVCGKIQAGRKEELARVLETENEFADYWVAEEERLNDLLAQANERLEVAKLAKRHERRQEALEEAFSQRYERAEYIPEKELACRYRVYSVPVRALFGDEMLMLDQMQRLVDEKPAGWLAEGRKLYASFVEHLRSVNGPYVVDAKNCVVNNVAASQMSDIMGVEYGVMAPAKEMLSVNYDITGTFRVYWKFIDADYQLAQKKLHNMRVYMVRRLKRDGIEFHDGDKVWNYDLLASNNSKQKKGQCDMGEHTIMQLTERLREFGWTMKDAIAHRTDNAAEWLKRNSTLTTPSKIIRNQDGETISIMKVLMVDDVDIERWYDNVTTIDGTKLSKAQRKKLKQTMFDGQALWLKDGMPSTQGRGVALKFMAVALPGYPLPEYTVDIMGNKVRVADYDILMTKSCWKAAKMGMNWYEFRDKVMELSKECEGYDLLRSVRYSDREIGDEENPRNLARQATQQFVKVNPEDIEGLTRNTRRWLKNNKRVATILRDLGEWDLPEDMRSPLAKLFNRFPQLIEHPFVKQFLKNSWDKKRDKACSGRLRTKGVYPYICQDPVAMIQICLEGRDPNEEGLGVVPEGKVNLPKVTSGRKMYCIRYPANYLVGMVVEQINCPEFANLGNVAVLSYYGDTITRADGDFDGDEMLFIFDKLVIELMERIVKNFHPSLIDFPHGKVDCSKPFGTEENFDREIAEALVRAQEFNLVGRYSNLAVICLQQASLAKDPVTCSKWLNAAKIAHVGAIVCLDMVKGAAVPEELTSLLEEMNETIRDQHKMPWNQLFSHKELTADDVEPRSNSTQDQIAGCVLDDVGEFEIEYEEDQEVLVWDDSIMLNFVPVGVDMTSPRNFVVSEEDMRCLHGCHFDDCDDKAIWKDMENGNAIGLKNFMLLGWHNSASILWKMNGADMTAKRNELYRYIRRVVMGNVLENKWTSGDGRVWTLTEKYVSTVRALVRMAFTTQVNSDGTMQFVGNNIAAEQQGSWTMFILRVFAEDLLAIADAGVVTDDLVRTMCATQTESDDEQLMRFFDQRGLGNIQDMLDDCIWLSNDEEEEFIPDFDVA